MTQHEPTGPTPGAEEAGAFDAHRPPDPGLLADCVHCGFCLPACPTYQLWGEEMDSPRGRIHLMELARNGEVAVDETFVAHMDACLGCMACVTACPSGVQYDRLIEATRAQIERNYDRSRAERLARAALFAVFPFARRLRLAVVLGWLYQRLGLRALAHRLQLPQRLPRRLAALEGLMPRLSLRELTTRVPRSARPDGTPRLRVALLTGCVQSVLFARVNAATMRVLVAEGCEVLAPSGSPCCGALMVHAGDEPRALRHARATIERLEELDADVIVTNAAGCGSTLKEYGQLLADDPEWAERAAAVAAKARDASELLEDLEPVTHREPLRATVAYHDACHLAHAQGVRAQPRRLLRSIPGLQLAELAEPDLCCGSAGVYNLLQPSAAEDLGRRKAAHVAAAAPDLVATGNPGCTLQLQRYLGPTPPVVHPIELLDASIRGTGLPGLDGSHQATSLWRTALRRSGASPRSAATRS